jgi:hypothetical protein
VKSFNSAALPVGQVARSVVGLALTAENVYSAASAVLFSDKNKHAAKNAKNSIL